MILNNFKTFDFYFFPLPPPQAYVSNWQLALKDVVTSLILAIIIIVVAVSFFSFLRFQS
jgi:hypothetical protein